MNKMVVSPWLMVSSEGPITCATEETSAVHMRQGDADSACGPYTLMMGLITLGILERSQIANMSAWHGNSREGRFRNALKEHGALVSRGTSTQDLIKLANHFSGVGLLSKRTQGSKKALIDEIQNAIESDAIPLIGVSWSRFEGHWLMVVGHQGFEDGGDYQPTHLLCLDPLSEAPKASLWNAVIAVNDEEGNALRGGTFTCDHWGLNGQELPCKLDELLTLSSS